MVTFVAVFCLMVIKLDKIMNVLVVDLCRIHWLISIDSLVNSWMFFTTEIFDQAVG